MFTWQEKGEQKIPRGMPTGGSSELPPQAAQSPGQAWKRTLTQARAQGTWAALPMGAVLAAPHGVQLRVCCRREKVATRRAGFGACAAARGGLAQVGSYGGQEYDSYQSQAPQLPPPWPENKGDI